VGILFAKEILGAAVVALVISFLMFQLVRIIEGSDPKYSDFRLLNTRFKEPALKLKKSVIVAAIFRDGKLIIPSGDTAIRKNDQVIIATSKKMLIRDLNDIL